VKVEADPLNNQLVFDVTSRAGVSLEGHAPIGRA